MEPTIIGNQVWPSSCALIQNGRLIDPASGRDERADVAIAAGRIVRIGHMGWVDWADVAAGLYALNDSLRAVGGYSGSRDYLERGMAAYRAALKGKPGDPLPQVYS